MRTPPLLLSLCAFSMACSDAGAPQAEGVGSSSSADSTECSGGAYIDGIDVYDGTGTIDWNAAAGTGLRFAIIKATQGNYDTQSTFAADWAGAKAAGLARSAYHFFDPTVDGVEQADYFLAVMGKLEAGDMPPMLDIECPDGDADCLATGTNSSVAPSLITSRMNDWLSTVKANVGVAPIVYSYASYFASEGVDPSGLSAYPLNVAYPTSSDCFDVPSPWTSATLWQNSWTATVAGIAGPVDTDRFLGGAAAFQAFLVAGSRSIPGTIAPLPSGATTVARPRNEGDAGVSPSSASVGSKGSSGAGASAGGCGVARRADPRGAWALGLLALVGLLVRRASSSPRRAWRRARPDRPREPGCPGPCSSPA